MKNFSYSGTHSRLFPKTRARPLVLAIALLFASPVLMAQPTGGQVVNGQASIGSPVNGSMTINQSSQKAIINWQSFSIGIGEATHFQQPAGGVALNRITGGNASEILGSLSSTGQVFLVNPSGILFGKGAVLNVGGLVASTLDIGNADFLEGNYRFFNDGAAGGITNQGQLSAYDGGYIALLAPEVRNEGVISARLGTVAIGAGNKVSLDLAGDGLINLNIEESALNGRIVNKQAIHADGGQVILSARAANSLAETVINNEGLIRASSVLERNGRIVLEGAHFVSQSGRLQASGSSGLDGGSIKIEADNVLLAGSADVSGNQGGEIDVRASGNLIQTDGSVMAAIGHDGTGGRINLQANNADGGGQVFLSGAVHADGNMGGQVRVLGDKVTLADAEISATGASLGGEILIGGGYQGAVTGVAHARETSVNPFSTLDVSATDYGKGGRVIVWSNGRTAFAGTALARGGVRGGDGGLIEVSGKEDVFYDGHVNAGPTPGLGNNGTFLLDPKNIVISASAQSIAGYFELADPSPVAGDRHGYYTQPFGNNQLLVLSPFDSNAAAQAGAIYVYNTTTGAMLSMLTGDQSGDKVGSGGIATLLNNSGHDYLIKSPLWHGSAGAVTWFDGAGSGFSGVVSATNSLVGSTASDGVGSGGITTNLNGSVYDYFVLSPNWNGTLGAVTFGNGATGVSGVVSSSNSFVGDQPGDKVGSGGIATLPNNSGYDYLIKSPLWHGSAGAVTWFDGSGNGFGGVVGSDNSLVGSAASDGVGSGGITMISNADVYDYVVLSPNWNGGLGAVTFGDAATGIVGTISSINSLIGSQAADHIGSGGVTALSSGNYVVSSPNWSSGKGAVTFSSGATGVSGVLSSNNSLIGSAAGDGVGSGGITTILNGGVYDYVVLSPNWNGGLGAVTFGDGATGIAGTISGINSLIGSQAADHIGSGGVTALSSGNYVVSSPVWSGGKGAVTFSSGATGISGTISDSNSLIGSAAGDGVGSGGITTVLNNGVKNYVVNSPDWGGGKGAVTFGSGATGIAGTVSSGNSLVGSVISDGVGFGGVQSINNNGSYNYLVFSPDWNNSAGAVTFGSGATGVQGFVNTGNSYVGDQAGDRVGSNGVTTLSNTGGYAYLIKSPVWQSSAGAVTWFDGSGSGFGGVVGAGNSLVGSNASDGVGFGGINTFLDSGVYNYLVFSPGWNGTLGAVTFGNGATGVKGFVSSSNSYVGDQAGDRVGSHGITLLESSSGSDFVIKSPLWHGSTGAVTWSDGNGSGFGGLVNSSNSLVGGAAGDGVGSGGITTIKNGNNYDYGVRSPNWGGGKGAMTFGSGATGVTGLVSASNSILGAQAGDLASLHIDSLDGGRYLLSIDSWGGNVGRLLVVSSEVGSSGWGYAATPGSDITLSPAQIAAIANTGTEVLLQANNDITLATGSNIVINNPEGQGGNLIFRAGRSILLNSSITSDGDVGLYANDTAANGVQAAYRDSGLAEITMAAGTSINSAGGVQIHMLDGLSAGTAGGITLGTVLASEVDFLGDILGNVSVTQGIFRGTGTIHGNLSVTNATLAPGHSPGAIAITGDLNLGSGSVLSIEFGGAGAGEFDSISVGGTAVLGGTLELLSYNGYTPPPGFNPPFLTGDLLGSFSDVTGALAGLVPIPSGSPAPELINVQTQVQGSIDPGPELPLTSSPPSSLIDLDNQFKSILSYADEAIVVGATQQIQSAAIQIGVRREARMQTFAQAISELRANPKSADVSECTDGGKGETSGSCLATRKVRDIDKLIADAPVDTRKRVALLIGNDAYTGDIPALTTPISDVDAIASKLKEKHGFDVVVLRNAKKADIIREMNRLATDTVVADSVMVMYAGHGYQDEANKGNKGMGYWIPVDAKANSASGWVSNQDISKLLFAIPARQVMLVSDSCFSGSLTREQRVKAVKGLKRDEVLKQRSVLVLSSGGEEPVTDLGHEGHSIFAWNLLKVLDSAERELTGFELYRQVHEGVIKEYPQQPQYGASIFAGHKGEGDYYLDRLN